MQHSKNASIAAWAQWYTKLKYTCTLNAQQ